MNALSQLARLPRRQPTPAQTQPKTMPRKRTAPRHSCDVSAEEASRFWLGLGAPTARGCREWQRATTAGGYGAMWVGGKTVYAHRLAYQLAKGPIPAGMLVLHACDNPRCCNPQHLSVGTNRDNMIDMVQKGRDCWRERHDA